MRIHLMEKWYSRSDPGMAKDIIEVTTMRHFAEINLISSRIPDETIIPTLRHLLKENNLCEKSFQKVKAHLKGSYMAKKQGIIIDATLIAASSSTKYKEGNWEPETHQT